MNPNDKISRYFTWKEALYLPKWERMAVESDGVNQSVLWNLKLLFHQMDTVREFFQKPIIVHNSYRSRLYNKVVNGATNSAHLCLGKGVAAVDFHVKGMSCMTAKLDILTMLTRWDMRLERNGIAADWLHMDIGKPGPRYFIR